VSRLVDWFRATRPSDPPAGLYIRGIRQSELNSRPTKVLRSTGSMQPVFGAHRPVDDSDGPTLMVRPGAR